MAKPGGGQQWLLSLRDIPYKEASEALCQLSGIGPKAGLTHPPNHCLSLQTCCRGSAGGLQSPGVEQKCIIGGPAGGSANRHSVAWHLPFWACLHGACASCWPLPLVCACDCCSAGRGMALETNAVGKSLVSTLVCLIISCLLHSSAVSQTGEGQCWGCS